MTSSPPPSAVPLKDLVWNGRNIFALAAALVSCWLLLDTVLYCDTSYRNTFNGRCTLTGLFLSTFWNDLKDQFSSFMSGTPSGSTAAEVTSSEWTQCILVPPLTLFLVWWLWPKLREAPVRGHASGYALLGAGLLIYLGGYMAENYYIGVVSMELVYAGIIVLFLGWEMMRLVAFPWAFLLFMWPYGFLEDIAFQLRLLMSDLSHHTLGLIGVANILNGTSILSPSGTGTPFAIDIADPCSGIRSFSALLMIASLYAFLSFDHLWQKILVILAAIPFVIIGNLVRIVMLTLGTIHFGSAFALGVNDHPSWFHEGAGYVVYLVDLAGLAGFGWFLNRFTPAVTESTCA
ncbi:MAG TPA: exosortase/archaeosortase family protein [Candidatus Methylacidiphilales bacterium]|nr:exosortase/archaeosortase family protein [Candidatus Methylacidiphilales bacterium]